EGGECETPDRLAVEVGVPERVLGGGLAGLRVADPQVPGAEEAADRPREEDRRRAAPPFDEAPRRRGGVGGEERVLRAGRLGGGGWGAVRRVFFGPAASGCEEKTRMDAIGRPARASRASRTRRVSSFTSGRRESSTSPSVGTSPAQRVAGRREAEAAEIA